MPLVAVLKPVEVEVERLVEMLLVAVLRPDDVELERLVTLLLVELKPVERLEMPLVACSSRTT
jgi:hypothetical protein